MSSQATVPDAAMLRRFCTIPALARTRAARLHAGYGQPRIASNAHNDSGVAAISRR